MQVMSSICILKLSSTSNSLPRKNSPEDNSMVMIWPMASCNNLMGIPIWDMKMEEWKRGIKMIMWLMKILRLIETEEVVA